MRNSYILYKEKLTGEYKNKFEQVDKYCAVLLDGVDLDAQNEIMSEILDTFLSSQNDKIPIEKITGDDIVKFCEQACSNIPIKYRIKNVFKLFKFWAWIDLIFAIPTVLIGLENTSFWDIKTEIGDLISFLPIAGAIELIYLNIAKLKIKKDLKQNKISIITKLLPIILVIIMFAVSLTCASYIHFEIPIWIDIFVSGMIVILYKLIYGKQKIDRIEFSSVVASEEIQNEKQRFLKYNQKLLKKGKKELTEQEYLQRLIKKSKNAIINTKIDIILAIIIAFTVAIVNYFNEGLEDSIILFFILLFIESIILIPYCRGINKLSKKLLTKYNYWLENNIPMEEWK